MNFHLTAGYNVANNNSRIEGIEGVIVAVPVVQEVKFNFKVIFAISFSFSIVQEAALIP